MSLQTFKKPWRSRNGHNCIFSLGEKYDEGRSSAEPELTWIFEKKARSVDELKSEVFNREDDCVPTVQPHRSMPGTCSVTYS